METNKGGDVVFLRGIGSRSIQLALTAQCTARDAAEAALRAAALPASVNPAWLRVYPAAGGDIPPDATLLSAGVRGGDTIDVAVRGVGGGNNSPAGSGDDDEWRSAAPASPSPRRSSRQTTPRALFINSTRRTPPPTPRARALELVGRVVRKAFAGHGSFYGLIDRAVGADVHVTYTDGDAESLTLEEARACLQPAAFVLPARLPPTTGAAISARRAAAVAAAPPAAGAHCIGCGNVRGFGRAALGNGVIDPADLSNKVTYVAHYMDDLEEDLGKRLLAHGILEHGLRPGQTVPRIPGRKWVCVHRRMRGSCGGGVGAWLDADAHKKGLIRPHTSSHPSFALSPAIEAVGAIMWLKATPASMDRRPVYIAFFHLPTAATLRKRKITQADILRALTAQAAHLSSGGARLLLCGDWNMPRDHPDLRLLAQRCRAQFISEDSPTRWGDRGDREAAALGNPPLHPRGSVTSIDHMLSSLDPSAFAAVGTELSIQGGTFDVDHAFQWAALSIPFGAPPPGPRHTRRPKAAAWRFNQKDFGVPAKAAAFTAASASLPAPPAANSDAENEAIAAALRAAMSATISKKRAGGFDSADGAATAGFDPKTRRLLLAHLRQRRRCKRIASDAAPQVLADAHRRRRQARAQLRSALAAARKTRDSANVAAIALAGDKARSVWAASRKCRLHRAFFEPPPPPAISRADGTTTASDDEAAAEFASRLAQVGAPPPPSPTTTRWTRERARVEAEAASELHLRTGIQAPFTTEEVAAAAAAAKSLSAPGADLVPYEAIAHAHASMILRITALYNTVLDSGIAPAAWKNAAVWMLAKGGKDHSEWDGFRGISLTSAIGKIFERCLLNRLTPHFEHRQSPLQMGFRKHHSRDDAILCLSALVRMGQTRPGSFKPGVQYAAFIDVRRAFPSVPHDAMLTALYDTAKVGGKCFRAISNLYNGLTSTVAVGDATSAPYGVECGTREGAILSPWLYSVFIDPLLQRLSDPAASRQGSRASIRSPLQDDPMYIPCVGFADDLALVSSTAEGLQDLLNVAAAWANEHLVQFAREKSNVVVFDGAEAKTDAECNAGSTWTLPALFRKPDDPTHSRIAQKASYVYLGATLHHSRSWTPHTDAAARDYRLRIAPNLVDRGLGAFGAGGAASATVWEAVGACALDKAAAVSAAANVTPGALNALDDEWRHATSSAIGGRSAGGAAHTAIEASTGFRLTLHRREEALAKAINRWDSLPPTRLPHRIMVAARAKDAMGHQWRRAATKACADSPVIFPGPAAPPPRYSANKTIAAAVRARQAADRAVHDAGKPQMALFDAIVDRQCAWGAPASSTTPFVSRPVGLGYSIYRQFATSTPRLNAFDFAATHSGACAHTGCGGDKETPEHIISNCSSPPLTAARSAFLACCGRPAGYQISHDDFIAIMALDAHFAPSLGFLPSAGTPSFEGAVFAFLRAVGRARFGAGVSVADRDRRTTRPPAPPPPPPPPM